MRFRRVYVSVSAVLFVAVIAYISSPPPLGTVEGRPLLEWLDQVEFESMHERKEANEILYSAGPRIVPDLSRLLLQSDSSWLERLSTRWPMKRFDSRYDRLKIKANAAWVISVIACRNPTCTEARNAVPSLVAGLGSTSPQVRYVSAQALAAIGPGASNAVPELVRSTADDSSSVRFCAVEALGRIGVPTEDVAHAVRARLVDADEDVRICATQTWQRVKGTAK